MSQSLLESSDSVRHARPLRHAQSITFDQPLDLELGSRLASVTAAYETYGQLNAAKTNAILVCHAISGDSHVARHDEQDDPGWWDIMVGPAKPIDTTRFFVIYPNLLGGCRGISARRSARSTPSCSCKARRPSRCASASIPRTRSKSPASSRRIRW